MASPGKKNEPPYITYKFFLFKLENFGFHYLFQKSYRGIIAESTFGDIHRLELRATVSIFLLTFPHGGENSTYLPPHVTTYELPLHPSGGEKHLPVDVSPFSTVGPTHH